CAVTLSFCSLFSRYDPHRDLHSFPTRRSSDLSGAAVEPRGPRPKPFFTPRKIIIYSILVMFSLYYLFPLYVMFTTSLKTMPEILFGNTFSLPPAPSSDAWVNAWTSACTGLTCEGVAPGVWTSDKITIPSANTSIFIAAVNGYAQINWRFKGPEISFAIVIFGSFIP